MLTCTIFTLGLFHSVGANENDTKVWYRFDDEAEAVKNVLDKHHPAQFIFTTDVRYALERLYFECAYFPYLFY